MFDEENFSFQVSVCPSTINTFNHDYEAMYFSQNFFVFSHNFHFVFAKFSHYFFHEIITLSFSHFSRAHEMRKRSKMVAKRFFLFAGNPKNNTDWKQSSPFKGLQVSFLGALRLNTTYNGTLKIFVRSKMNQISMFLFKNVRLFILICGFSVKLTCVFHALSELNTF